MYDQSRLIDLTAEQPNPPGFTPPKHRIQQGKVVWRSSSTIIGIVVHQTACLFGASPAAIQQAGGDKLLATYRRALGVAANVTAFRTGKAVYANPLNWYVYNANLFNAYIVSLEIEGVYPGLWKRGSDLFTGEIEQAARTGLAFLVEQGRAKGMPIKYIWAHRQSSADRRSDPGEEIWRKLVLDFAVPQLGLVVDTKKVVGDGRPVPQDWDPNGVGKF